MAFFTKTVIPVLSRTCKGKYLAPTGVFRALQSSSTCPQKAQQELLKAVDTELTFARKEFQKLPEVPSFKCSTEGAVATFTRTVDNEKIVVTLDTNSGVEMDLMGGEMAESSMDNDIDDDTEEDSMATVPAFTVTTTKPSGTKMLFECSFHPSVTDFDDLVMMIDTVSVIPKDCKNEESLYSVECNQLGKELQDGLEKYLSERGVNRKFGSELLSFFSTFEHHAYASSFLKDLQTYCKE